ncbi:MAG: ERF family protein [Clostridia bacterium]|jgi:hypothetical protein|nr:ERF family protein [Clostridia bacterium]
MNIYEKILSIMQDVQYLAKDDHIKFGNSTDYKALSEEKVTSIMRNELINNKLVVFPIAQDSIRTGNITHVDTKYRMVNVENPDEFIEIVSCGDGADTQDKGSGKAMTYAFKYMWLRTFALPTREDPDKISSSELDDKIKKEAEKKAAQPEYIDEIKQTVILKELHRTGWDTKSMLSYLAKKFPKNPPKAINKITIPQFTFIVKALEKKPDKA